ncbi:MAG: hypothetical protein H0X66_12305 [Verrucomicrobia bacterium]|nr:hypothetical protein [Verrucomicrobiota bacterium]
MKKILLILPVAAVFLSGCIAYQPSPVTGQYGYTYDYQLPLAEGIPAPVYQTIAEPRRTIVTAPGAPASVPVVADLPPPPTTPPIYSEIPEMTPRERVVERRTTIIVPQQPQVVQEAAGAQPGVPGVVQQPAAAAPVPVYPPSTVYSGILGATNVPPPGATNGIIPPVTNIIEGPQSEIPERLPPAQRLPEQPRLPGAQEQQLEQQPPGIPNPAPNLKPFSPAAAPEGTQAPEQAPQAAPSPVQPVQPFAPPAPDGQSAPQPVQPQTQP